MLLEWWCSRVTASGKKLFESLLVDGRGVKSMVRVGGIII